jgi:hypothetical protein
MKMKRQSKNPKIVALGRASKATKGNWGPYSDDIIMQAHPGLAAD